ncbi:TetR/AcrR family transcriptional regulator [Actinobacteria bacterium YIM 96077]|uniref:TetR/AcrR family transcriptional regulator n=1 Tax=Phytoactinopolyspora halophila TaxID=1981511 RepID=A0A329QVJ3_9ACTN|nr:TetR/AcrR family transcriptional regulator [Phytoactinopolyspora halophila]AYY12881.1 TetR/AcrR family transcriptional regulator [Actinobacteria bacterium YIM 96077]RAW16325.1 TetR/AcrR family transcriptional regulator [Phytoactinopolyspora halophila]
MADRGRPRSFDRDAALRQAMELFWEHGYEGVAISDLTRAMGINTPSLYSAFHGKAALFREALDLYARTAGSMTDRALAEEPTARRAVEAILRGNATLYAQPGRPSGCMFVLSATNYSTKSSEVHDFVAEQRRKTVAAIERRLARGVREGELPAGTDVGAMAAFYGTVLHGMAIEARDGVSRTTLESIVDSAMLAWDTLLQQEDAAADPGGTGEAGASGTDTGDAGTEAGAPTSAASAGTGRAPSTPPA